MEIVLPVLQLVVGLGILNVWLLRFGKQTAWRGGDATNLKEEFRVYGLPVWFMYLVGALKITFSILLILGIWFPVLTRPAAIGIVMLMLGAVAMHFKAGDPVKKAMPATNLLVLSLLVVLLH